MPNQAFSIKRTLCTGLLLLVAFAGFLSLNRVRHKAFDLVSDTLPGLAYAGVANSDSAEDVNFILLSLMASTTGQKTSLCAQADAFETDAAKYLKLYEDSIFENADRDNFNRTLESRKQFLEVRQQVIGLMNRSAETQALAVYKQALLPRYEQYMTDCKVLLDYNVHQGQERGASILRFSSLTQYAVAAFTIALFILGFAIGIFRYDPIPRRPQPAIVRKPLALDGRLSKAER